MNRYFNSHVFADSGKEALRICGRFRPKRCLSAQSFFTGKAYWCEVLPYKKSNIPVLIYPYQKQGVLKKAVARL